MPGQVCSAENATPVPTEDTACIELIGMAERAVAARLEALGARADDEAGHRLCVALENDETRGKCTVKALPAQGDAGERACGREPCDMVPRGDLADDV
jgi:hypothetical protein